MKKLVILSIFISTTTLGQFFESDESNYESQDSFSQNQFFNEPEQETYDVDPHPGDVDPEVPINNWLFLLPLAALVIASHRIWRQQQEKI